MRIFNVGGRVVNNYLYYSDSGYVLIDTGYESGYEHFLSRLKRLRINPQEIAYVFLTHAHDDHAGFLNRLLLDNSGIKVILNAKAFPALRRGQNSFEGGCTGRLALAFCRLMKLLGKGSHHFPLFDRSFEQRCLVVTDETRETIGRAIGGKIYDTPGHTGDSISLLLKDGSLFCGDAAMNGIPALHKVTIWAEDKADYIASWNRIIDLRPNIIYPGHGKPFSYSELKNNMSYARRIKLYPMGPED